MAAIPTVWRLLLLLGFVTYAQSSKESLIITTPIHIEFDLICYNKLNINEMQNVLKIDDIVLSILYKSGNLHLIMFDRYKYAAYTKLYQIKQNSTYHIEIDYNTLCIDIFIEHHMIFEGCHTSSHLKPNNSIPFQINWFDSTSINVKINDMEILQPKTNNHTFRSLLLISSHEPTLEPTLEPTMEPTVEPTIEPTINKNPILAPTIEPTIPLLPSYYTSITMDPTIEPTMQPNISNTEPDKSKYEKLMEIWQKHKVWIILGALFVFGLIVALLYCLCITYGCCCNKHRDYAPPSQHLKKNRKRSNQLRCSHESKTNETNKKDMKQRSLSPQQFRRSSSYETIESDDEDEDVIDDIELVPTMKPFRCRQTEYSAVATSEIEVEAEADPEEKEYELNMDTDSNDADHTDSSDNNNKDNKEEKQQPIIINIHHNHMSDNMALKAFVNDPQNQQESRPSFTSLGIPAISQQVDMFTDPDIAAPHYPVQYISHIPHIPLPQTSIPEDLPNLPNAPNLSYDTDTEMIGEGFDLNEWIMQTLKECAPQNDEWKEYWNNFQKHKITEDVLITLSADKHNQNDVWKELIPIIGPRIRFQEKWEKELLRQQQKKIL